MQTYAWDSKIDMPVDDAIPQLVARALKASTLKADMANSTLGKPGPVSLSQPHLQMDCLCRLPAVMPSHFPNSPGQIRFDQRPALVGHGTGNSDGGFLQRPPRRVDGPARGGPKTPGQELPDDPFKAFDKLIEASSAAKSSDDETHEISAPDQVKASSEAQSNTDAPSQVPPDSIKVSDGTIPATSWSKYHKEQFPRRRGRDASQRNPDLDSPLRDGNRDRLAGMLTDRASKTLLFYCSETNQNLYRWLYEYIKENPIPTRGTWEDVSGETFLRKLLIMPVNLDVKTSYGLGVDPMYDCSQSLSVDPRQVARRLMEIRIQLANEWKEDLELIREENTDLMRDAMMSALPKLITADEAPQ